MIAPSGHKSTRIVAIQDLLLVALATAVIALSQIPRGPARQMVELRDANGHFQTYSFDLDDPRLAKLRQQSNVDRGPDRRPSDVSLSMLKWQSEAAGFYAELTDPLVVLKQDFTGSPPANSIVMPASLNSSDPSAPGEPEVFADQHQYWLKLRDESVAALAAADARLEQQRTSAELGTTRLPVRFGSIVIGGYTPSSLLLASAIGLCAAIVMAWWAFACPTIGMATAIAGVSSQPTKTGEPDPLRLAIPSAWVRVHQPAAVIARRIVYTTLVITALACVAT